MFGGTMAVMPPFDLYGYQAPVSLWALVEEHCPGHEREEIKAILGDSLVEQSMELHTETETLLEIWRDFRCESYAVNCQKRLPEPPALRERLVQEIKFFVENIEERANRHGVDPDKILSSHNKDVLDYAVEKSQNSGNSSRPATVVTRDGRETPRMTTPTTDRLSAASTLSEEVEAMNSKLNILELDEVVQHLRQTLEEEISQLTGDISFLQGCLEDESNFRNEPLEPSISDLREERASLEKDLLKTDLPLPSPPQTHVRPAVPSQLRKYAPLTSTTAGTSGRISGHSATPPLNGGTKTVPIKATHHISPTKISFPAKEATNSTAAVGRTCGKQHGQRGEKSATAVRIRVGSNAGRAQVFQISAVSGENGTEGTVEATRLLPSPPSSARPKIQRPTSADRFRKMVLECRDGT